MVNFIFGAIDNPLPNASKSVIQLTGAVGANIGARNEVFEPVSALIASHIHYHFADRRRLYRDEFILRLPVALPTLALTLR